MTQQVELDSKDMKKAKSKKGGFAVYDMNGKEVDNQAVNKKLFDGEVNKILIQEIVRMFQARARSGNASTKTRAEVSGGGKKPWRQKGTGRARFGSSRNPIWTGGGIAFGPKPKDHGYSMPKAKIKKGLRSILNAKYLEDAFRIIDKFECAEPKTKVITNLLKALHVNRRTLLITRHKENANVYKSARNIEFVTVQDINSVNCLDLVRAKYIVLEKESFKSIVEGLVK